MSPNATLDLAVASSPYSHLPTGPTEHLLSWVDRLAQGLQSLRRHRKRDLHREVLLSGARTAAQRQLDETRRQRRDRWRTLSAVPRQSPAVALGAAPAAASKESSSLFSDDGASRKIDDFLASLTSSKRSHDDEQSPKSEKKRRMMA